MLTQTAPGVIQIRPPSPPPAPRPRQTERETDIDIYTSRHETEVDVHRRVSHSRGRARSPSVERHRRPSVPAHYHDDDVIVRSDRNRLEVDGDVDINGRHQHLHRSMSPGGHHRRAHSAAPPRAATRYYDDEAEYITSRIEDRGRVGEALHGATRDWEIVDVPPGTERVRMDGAGGGAAEVTWSKYSGVRRAKFLPEGDDVVARPAPRAPSRGPVRERESDTRINVLIHDDKKEERPVKEKRSDMWTEITKDLVSRAAIEEMGYEYEETEYFYYILTYLRYVSLFLPCRAISRTDASWADANMNQRRTSSSWSSCRTASGGRGGSACASSSGSAPTTATSGTRTTTATATGTTRGAATTTRG